MADLDDWFQIAKSKAEALKIPPVKASRQAEMDDALPQQEKGFGEQAGEVLGGVGGTIVGGLGEQIGRAHV